MSALIAAALALTCICLHAVQRGTTDDNDDDYYGHYDDDDHHDGDDDLHLSNRHQVYVCCM